MATRALDPIASSVSGPVGAAESYSRQGEGCGAVFLAAVISVVTRAGGG